MRITFSVYGCATKPIGGHKVIYEMANRLSAGGHEVTIVFSSQGNLYQLPFPAAVRVLICRILTYTGILPGWFRFSKKVRLKTVNGFDERFFPEADAVIATARITAEPVSELPACKGKKYYLIQDFEDWDCTAQEVTATYQLGMTNITIAKWLRDLVQQYDAHRTLYLPNAIDSGIFCIKRPVEDRHAHVIGLLYHTAEHKGLKYSFEALDMVKRQYPDTVVKIFGTAKRPPELPEWYEYHYRLQPEELCELYNACSVFLCGTVEEGFGLTGAESMACGCAFVSTDYKGVHEYAVDHENVLLSPIRDPAALAEHVIYLFEHEQERTRLALAGAEAVNKRNWDYVIRCMEVFLNQ